MTGKQGLLGVLWWGLGLGLGCGLGPLLYGQEASPAHVVSAVTETEFVGRYAEVPLRLEQWVSSETARKGDPIRLTLAKNLYDGGTLVAPAGATVSATVSHVRASKQRRAGELRFSDVDLDLGNGRRLRLRQGDPQDRLGAGAIPAILVGAVTLGPITVAFLPVQLVYLLIHAIHEHGKAGGAAKREFVHLELEEGSVLVYYADHRTLAHR